MAVAKPRFTKRVLLFVLFGLLVLMLYFYYFVGTLNIIDVIKRVNLLCYTSAFIAFLVSVLFYSLAWQSLLRNLNINAKIQRVLLLTWTGMFFDVTIPDPGWSGDLSKAYMLAKTSGHDTGRIVASVVGQKIIGMVITVVDLILGLALLALSYTLSSTVLIFIAIILFLSAFSLVVVSYLSAKPGATKRILNWLIRVIFFVRRGHWNPQDFRLKAEELLNTFHEGIGTLSANLRSLVRPVTFSLVSWGFDVSVTFLTFLSLGYSVPLDKVLIVYALTGSLQIIGVSFIGFTEVVMSGAYTVLGIQPALSLAVTLLTRVVTLWFKLVVSYVAFQWAGVEILTGKKTSDSAEQIAHSK